jgi:hypothetical protein
MRHWIPGLLLAAVLLAGCSQKGGDESAEGGSLQGERNSADSFLAYEHDVTVELPEERIHSRLEAAQDACRDGRFGECHLLGAEQSSGRYPSASLKVRIVPEGVAKLVEFASEGGELVRRHTSTEDLAQAVADNRQQREQLERQRQTLLQYQTRTDLSVSDMLALAKELASVDVQLQTVAQEAAQQRRRIDTNLLTLRFVRLSATDSRLGRIGEAFSGLLDKLAEGTVAALELTGYGLPFLLLLFPLALFIRWLWRKITLRGQSA